MSEKHISWYNRLNGGLWQAEVEHGGLPERRETFEDGENFDTRFGYPSKRCGYERITSARPGTACLKTRYGRRGRAHIQFGSKRLGGTAPREFLMGISFYIPDDFRLESNQCAPLLYRRGVTFQDKGTWYYHEFKLYLRNVGGALWAELDVMTRDPVGGTYAPVQIAVVLDAALLLNGGWHRLDFQYWENGGAGHVCLIFDGLSAYQTQVDFTADHYWLDTAADAAGGGKHRHAGQVFAGGLPGQNWDPLLTVHGLIKNLYIAEFRYDEEAYYLLGVSKLYEKLATYTGRTWIDGRANAADVVTHMDEGGGLLLEGKGTAWEIPGGITNSKPAWQPEGGLTLLGGTWQENPGIVVLETGDGKTPLETLFGPDQSKLVPEWTMHFRVVQPPFLGQDSEDLHISVIASEGFIDYITPANDESPGGWILAWVNLAGTWHLQFRARAAKSNILVFQPIIDPTSTAGEVWITVRRKGTNLCIDSTYGFTTTPFAVNLTTQLIGTEPVVFGAHFATLNDYRAMRSTWPQAMCTLKEFRVLPYAVSDERIASTDWRSSYQDPIDDYVALFHFREGQGDWLVDFSRNRLVGRIVDSGVNETYLAQAAVAGAPGTPGLWATYRYGDLMPLTWAMQHPQASTSTPIDAVTMYHHPQIGDRLTALGNGHAWEIEAGVLTDISADYSSLEVPKAGTLDYAQDGNRVYVADGSNRPQVLEVGRFRPAGIVPPPHHARPGVLPYPGADVTGWTTYLVCYENVETGTVSDGVVTDPVLLDNCGALIGWDAQAAAIQGIPCSEGAGALTNGAPALTWFSGAAGSVDFTWEGMVKVEAEHTGADGVLWTKADNATPQDILVVKVSHVGTQTQIKFFWRDAVLPAIPVVHASVDVPSIGIWHHYAWVYLAATGAHSFYVDGKLCTHKPLSASTPAIVGNAAGTVTITNVALPADGRYEFAEWRFWKVARTEDEIRNLYHVALKSSGDANLVFNLSLDYDGGAAPTYIDEVYRHAAANGANRALATGIISWLGAPDYSLINRSRDKYAPLPMCKDLATHVRFYRSTPFATGADPTAAEIETAQENAKAGPWRYVGQAPIGASYWVDQTYMDVEGAQKQLAEVEAPPVGAYYVERFGAMMVYGRTDLYPERLWFSRLYQPEVISASVGWVDVDDGTGEPITGLRALGDRLYVFKPTSIHAIVGTEPSLLQLALVSRGTGCESNRSLLTASGRLWMWANTGPAVLEGGQVASIAMPIMDDVRDISSPVDAIGVVDPKRHRVGWLVPLPEPGAAVPEWLPRDSAILWFDTIFQSWAKDRPSGTTRWTSIDCMLNQTTGVHDICLVDHTGWIYQLNQLVLTDGHALNTGAQYGSFTFVPATPGKITGLAGCYTAGDGLAGLPVLLVEMSGSDLTPAVSWHVVASNTSSSITISPAPAGGKFFWHLGAINFWVRKAWSDGGEPSAAKIFERFYWRPTTSDQKWLAYLSIRRAFADYLEPYFIDWTKIYLVEGDGRFQTEVWEQGVRMKWLLTAPFPGAAALQEAGWHGRILPGTAYIHTPGTLKPQTTDIWPGDGVLDALVDIKDGARPSTGEV